MTINSGDAAASVGNFLRQWHTVMEDKTHDRDLIKYSRCYVPWNTDFSTMVLPLLVALDIPGITTEDRIDGKSKNRPYL